MAMEEKIRIRLSFEDANILRKSQRSDGLQCCWMLLRSDLHTISAFSSFIVSTLGLEKKCPNGLLLSMDDHVLPQYETTKIFKDKDIVRIRRKKGKCRVITTEYTRVTSRVTYKVISNESEDVSFKGKEEKFEHGNHLPIKKSNKEHSGHGDKENATCQLTDSTNLAGPSCKTPSMKRKRHNDPESHTQSIDGKETESCNKNWEEKKKGSPSYRHSADTPEEGAMDFENLFPSIFFPKEGDVVAYKLVDLSKGYPLFSDFRVGNVSSFDTESRQVVLELVPGFPIPMDDEISQINPSPYKEDGSLEIDFASLLGARRLLWDFKNSWDMETANKIIVKALDILRGQWDSRRACCWNRKAADTISTNQATTQLQIPPAADADTTSCPTNIWDLASENKQNQGRNWDEIKSPRRMETAETSQWNTPDGAFIRR